MPKRISKSPAMLIFFTAFTSLLTGQDVRVSLFDQYNHATSYDDIKPLVSGVLAQQYAFLASHDPQRLPQLLTQQQVASYRPRIVEIDNATSFLVLESVSSPSNRGGGAQAYLLSKDAAGKWTLANRMTPDSVLKTLWTTHFSPTDFVQTSSCSIDGTDIRPESALAIRRADSIEITLYPFKFSQPDLDYWRQASGIPVNADAVAGSHFNSRETAACRLIVRIDKAGEPSLLNVGFNDHTTALARSKLWPPSKADVSVLALDPDRIRLTTAGKIGTDTDGIRWNVKINVPVWERGL